MISLFKKGINNLSPRRFGTMTETMMQNMLHLANSHNIAYDKIKDKNRIEIKFSRAYKPLMDVKNNFIKECEQSVNGRENYSSEECLFYDFDCNIQQIKRKEFDVLYYGVFFADRIEIYKIRSNNISSIPNYCDIQHRGNNGEGQFHLTPKTILWHRQNTLFKIISYDELYKLLGGV